MAKIIFFEKPGCINGEKQKKILQEAGNSLHCIDIRTYSWSKENLLPFTKGRSPVELINSSAPAVKKGDIRPASLSFDEAMDLMVADPILIQRPLIEVDGLFIQGFNHQSLKPYLGNWTGNEDVITCPNIHSLSCDEKKEGKP